MTPTATTPRTDEPVDPERSRADRPAGRTAQPRRGRPSPHHGCPYLAADGRAWRSIAADRAHRCTAVSPPAVLAIDKQRRLCLVLEHTDCATYQAALAAHGLATPAGLSTAAGDELRGEPMTEPQATPEVDRVTRWAITRSTPVVLDHGRLPPAVTMLSPFRRGGQLALGSLLVVALSAVLGARLGAPPDGVPAGAVVSPSASASTTAASTPTPTVRVTPRPSPPASASAGPSVTAPVTPSPAPTASPVTYTVRSGDTLVRIASQFGTTAAAIATANGITDPGRLSVGQVLVIPVPSS